MPCKIYGMIPCHENIDFPLLHFSHQFFHASENEIDWGFVSVYTFMIKKKGHTSTRVVKLFLGMTKTPGKTFSNTCSLRRKGRENGSMLLQRNSKPIVTSRSGSRSSVTNPWRGVLPRQDGRPCPRRGCQARRHAEGVLAHPGGGGGRGQVTRGADGHAIQPVQGRPLLRLLL